MDAVQCRGRLAALLIDEERALVELTEALDTEYEALRVNSLAELEARSDVRTRSSATLLRIQEERRTLLRSFGAGTDLAALEKILTWCDPARQLATSWKRCSELATRCRELNERNSTMVAARLRRVEGMLEVITARPPASTYGRDAGLTTDAAGRLLTAEA